MKDTCYIFSPLFLLHCYSQVATSLRLFQNNLLYSYYSNAFPQSQRKTYLWEQRHSNYQNIIFRHKKRCSTGTLYCTQRPIFLTTSQAVLNYHVAMKDPRVRAKSTQCNFFVEEFSGFSRLRKHRSSQHGNPMKTSNLDMDTLLGDIDDTELREEPNSRKHFLVDSELEKGRRCFFFHFAMSSFNNDILSENMDHVCRQLKCAAEVNLEFGFVLKYIEDVMFRYFCKHENNRVMERSRLLCTQDGMANLKDKLQIMDIVIAQEKERTLNGIF